MSRGHSQMDRSLMKNSALSSMRPKNIPRWRQRSALEHRKLMLQSLSMRRQKTPSSNRAETRPGRVSWRSWLGPELCVPKEHLDAGMLLRMRQRKRKEWPAPVELLGRRGGGPSSQGLLSHWTLVPFFFICPPEFFLCGNLETSLEGCAGRGGGCGVGCRGKWGLGAALGEVEGVACGAVGAGAGGCGGGGWWGGTGRRGGGCWEPWRGRWRGSAGGRGGGCWEPWRGRWRGSAGRHGGGCWGLRRGRAGAPVDSYKTTQSPPPYTYLTTHCPPARHRGGTIDHKSLESTRRSAAAAEKMRYARIANFRPHATSLD